MLALAPDFLSAVLILSTALSATSVILLIPRIIEWHARNVKLDAIPTVGPSGFFTSYIGAVRYIKNAREVLLDGYQKYRGQAFKVALLDRWAVVVSGHNMIEDLKRASPEYISFREAVAAVLHTDFTLGKSVRVDPYHIDVVRTPLTRSIAGRFTDVRDEIVAAFTDEIPLKAEWTAIPTLSTVMRIVCRTSNRLFVGLPLCRDPDYRDLNIQFTIDTFIDAQKINMFPAILKPLVGRLMTKVSANVKRAAKHIEPIVKERLAKEQEYGTSDWPDKPNDLISWLLDEASGKQRNIDELAMRVLVVNLAAIHTTSMTFTTALFCLAAHTELVQPLRDEVEAAIEELGWSKAAIGKMMKLDSFLKECQRLKGINSISMSRMILKDFTFSDGTVVPKGVIVSAAAYPIHHDEELYQDAGSLNAFRFSDKRSQEGEGTKHQMVTPSLDYLLFGFGKHTCPGRFFAVNELKALLAHVLLNYDIKSEQEGVIPEEEWFIDQITPSRTAKVLFRKRAT